MRKPFWVVLALLAQLVFLAGIASASEIPCSISGGSFGSPLTGSTVLSCGNLTSSGFQVLNPTGGAAGLVDIVAPSEFDSATGAVSLTLNANLQASQSEQLLFGVTGGLAQIDLNVGGTNASILEEACANPIPTSGSLADLCTNSSGTMAVAPLGEITVGTGSPNQPVFSTPFATTSPVFIFMDIDTGVGGDLSFFNASFETSAVTAPEPPSEILLGCGLLGLVVFRRFGRHHELRSGRA